VTHTTRVELGDTLAARKTMVRTTFKADGTGVPTRAIVKTCGSVDLVGRCDLVGLRGCSESDRADVSVIDVVWRNGRWWSPECDVEVGGQE
jgi:hypothetical protein